MDSGILVQQISEILQQKLKPILNRLELLEKLVEEIKKETNTQKQQIISIQELKSQILEFQEFSQSFTVVEELAQEILQQTKDKQKEISRVEKNQLDSFTFLECMYEQQNTITQKLPTKQPQLFYSQNQYQQQQIPVEIKLKHQIVPQFQQEVYITQFGNKYHRSNCITLKNSKVIDPISRQYAEKKGLNSCSQCNP